MKKIIMCGIIGISSNKSVLYVSSERFINQYVDSAKNGNYNDFLHFYQMIDVLIVDDVQFFAKKEKTQEIFFQIFNCLHFSSCIRMILFRMYKIKSIFQKTASFQDGNH